MPSRSDRDYEGRADRRYAIQKLIQMSKNIAKRQGAWAFNGWIVAHGGVCFKILVIVEGNYFLPIICAAVASGGVE